MVFWYLIRKKIEYISVPPLPPLLPPPSPFSPLLVGLNYVMNMAKTNTFLGLKSRRKIDEYIFVI